MDENRGVYIKQNKCSRACDCDIINENFKASNFDETETNYILEQWKTSVEFAREISSRRLSMNGLFLTGLSILVGGIMFSDGLSSLTKIQQIVIIISICIMGLVLCRLWVRQLDYYSSLNKEKYDVIREMENYMPIWVFKHEYECFYKHGNSFSKIDKRIF